MTKNIYKNTLKLKNNNSKRWDHESYNFNQILMVVYIRRTTVFYIIYYNQ